MKVAFDVQLLLKGEKTGIAWCAESILLEMANKDKIKKQLNCFTFAYDKKQKKQVYSYQKLGYQIQECRWFHDVLYRLLWNYIPIPYSLFFRKKADVTVFFNYAVPPKVSGKTVVFVHDMAYRVYPETVRKKTRRFLELVLQKSCDRADRIVTISEFSKQEILKYLKVSEEKISVVTLGVDRKRFHTHYPADQIRMVQSKYGLKGEYLLYIGTIEPRKNLKRLIEAYASLPLETPMLVFAGKKGWMYREIFQTVETLGIGERVKFLGYVADREIPLLLSGAKCFLFPSLYEGFGLPPLEAMASGVPVVASNGSAIPEVVGDAAVLVEATKVESISHGILRVLKEKGLRERMIEKGIQRAKTFRWEKTARELLEICQRL